MWESEEGAKQATWAAPELYGATPQPMTQKSDIFSLGVVLFEIVSRQVPFEELSDKECREHYIAGKRPFLPHIFPAPKPPRASWAIQDQRHLTPQFDLFQATLGRQQDHKRAIEKGEDAPLECIERISRTTTSSFTLPSGDSIDATSDNSMVEVIKVHLKRLNSAQGGENLARLLAYESIVAVLSQCWCERASDRPSAIEVVQRLEQVRSTYAAVTNLLISDCRLISNKSNYGVNNVESAAVPSSSIGGASFAASERPTEVSRHTRVSSDSHPAVERPSPKSEIALSNFRAPHTRSRPSAAAMEPGLSFPVDFRGSDDFHGNDPESGWAVRES
jgi:serine/threonine protein kinase